MPPVRHHSDVSLRRVTRSQTAALRKTMGGEQRDTTTPEGILACPVQQTTSFGGPQDTSATKPPAQRSTRKKWKDFAPTAEDIERHKLALNMDADMEMVSDLSETEARTTWDHRTPNAQRASLVNGAARHARAHARAAQRRGNSVHMKIFSLEEATTTPHGRPETVKAIEPRGPTKVLHGDRPGRVVSADGYDIIYHLPGGLHGKNLDELVQAAKEWGYACKPCKTVSNDKKGGYKEAGDLVGTTRIVLAWHAIGHPHEEPGVCADVLRTRLTFNGACVLLEKLDVVNSYVMALLKQIDPKQYESLEKLHEWRLNKYASSRALSGLTKPQLFFEGREIQFNRFSKAHWDSQDPHFAWAIIIYFGTFGSCRLKFKQLRTEVVLRPGDVVAIRGQDLLHEADDWDFGERHLLVHFTHRALWNQAGIELKTSFAAPFTQ